MTDPSTRIPPDPDAVVGADTPCRKCAYNVRGLRYDGRCPECGTPVGVSTLGDLLRFSDPTWLAGLIRGLNLMLLAILVAILLVVIWFFIINLGPYQHWMFFGVTLIDIYGAWLLTEADPSGLGEAQYSAVRKVVRVTLAVGLLQHVLSAVTEEMSLASPLGEILDVVFYIAALVWLVGEFAKYLYLRRLAERIPNPKLAGRARFIQWNLPILLGLLTHFIGIISGAGLAGTGVALLLGVYLLVLNVMAILLLLRMRRALGEQRVLSQRLWAQVEREAG